MGKTVDYSLSHRIDRNFRNLLPVDSVALHFNPPSDIFDDVPDSSVNQLKNVAFLSNDIKKSFLVFRGEDCHFQYDGISARKENSSGVGQRIAV